MKWSKDGNFSIRKNHNHMDELRDYTKENQNSIYEIGQNVEPSHSVSSGQSLAVPAQRVHPWRGGPWQSISSILWEKSNKSCDQNHDYSCDQNYDQSCDQSLDQSFDQNPESLPDPPFLSSTYFVQFCTVGCLDIWRFIVRFKHYGNVTLLQNDNTLMQMIM